MFVSKKKEELYQLAMDEFISSGYHETTMRNLALKAGKSPGAFYRHFSSKEEIIHYFYLRELEAMRKKCLELEKSRLKLSRKLILFFQYRFESFQPYKEILKDLAGTSLDPKSPLSPFSIKSKNIKFAYIKMFHKLISSTNFSCSKKIRKYVGALFWLLMMAVLFFWIFDRTAKSKNTIRLIELVIPIVVTGFQATSFPLPKNMNRKVLEIIKILNHSNLNQ